VLPLEDLHLGGAFRLEGSPESRPTNVVVEKASGLAMAALRKDRLSGRSLALRNLL
jgi:hypothetical protein